jgi:hypothetical protein
VSSWLNGGCNSLGGVGSGKHILEGGLKEFVIAFLFFQANFFLGSFKNVFGG